eukprot:gnl/TRDRNA2_/TRDRNA2_175705_c0_seq1.p1 gnl/TRDRNA2_/TRDRNA2_175705_c0~~gnl/TRDRNA2_/TRDRNA2_175705_c0_seq1.p1  ORF type:complete len:114 (+),score=6.72 gnl/TRDRNA2_/TRDRNA2_175705_c0_seq1:38-343(+)
MDALEQSFAKGMCRGRSKAVVASSIDTFLLERLARPNESTAVYSMFSVELGTFTTVEVFMRRLEGSSFELHRKCPNNWNQLTKLIMRCLSGQRKNRALRVP